MSVFTSAKNRLSKKKHALTSSVNRVCMEMLEQRTLLSSNAVVQENLLPGTPQSVWDVNGGDNPLIQGFSTDISVNAGQTVNFKIDDTGSVAYHMDIYRMGYYQGNGA